MTEDGRSLALERCPKCGSQEIQRSHRKNIVERALSFAILPWRCTVCYVRFFRPSWLKTARHRINLDNPANETQAEAVHSH